MVVHSIAHFRLFYKSCYCTRVVVSFSLCKTFVHDNGGGVSTDPSLVFGAVLMTWPGLDKMIKIGWLKSNPNPNLNENLDRMGNFPELVRREESLCACTINHFGRKWVKSYVFTAIFLVPPRNRRRPRQAVNRDPLLVSPYLDVLLLG